MQYALLALGLGPPASDSKIVLVGCSPPPDLTGKGGPKDGDNVKTGTVICAATLNCRTIPILFEPLAHLAPGSQCTVII